MFTSSSRDDSESGLFSDFFSQLTTNCSLYTTESTEQEEENNEPTEDGRTMTPLRQGSPVLLAPTPGSGTTVRNIRHSKGTVFDDCMDSTSPSLPINNGSEAIGEAIVIDFETPLFQGSFLLRVVGVASTIDQGTKNYFDGKQRRFQAIVRGKFLQEIPASQCVTGQVFDHAPQRLPPLTKPLLRAVSAIAPQMNIDLYAEQPYVLSSLVATAKTLNQNMLESPTSEKVSLDDPDALSDEKETRKCLLEKDSVFRTDREYTFEFYQHMLDLSHPSDFVLTLAGWSVRLGPTLDGQPIRILGAWQPEGGGELQYIWSFDLLHEKHCAKGTQ